MERMTLEDASDAKPCASQRAMALDRFVGVARARRLEPAVCEHEVRQRELVATDECHYGPARQSLQRHVSVSTASVNSARSTANEAV